MERLDIVDLIEKNPVTKLSASYQGALLTKIQSEFTDEQQQLFVASFYCYLNYDTRADFVIDLDNVWRWLGFFKKNNAKQLLEKMFQLDIDYKIFAADHSAPKTGRGGHNKVTIFLTIKAFKNLCLKACTKKADQIHEYYIKLEETLQDVVHQESNELRMQLEQKDTLIQEKNHIILKTNDQLKNLDSVNKKERELLREKTVLDQFPENVQCIYYGIINNVSHLNEPLVKFGCSNHLSQRVKVHKKTFFQFRLMNAFRVDNKTLIENALKKHPILCKLRRTISIKETKHNELLAMHELSYDELDSHIKDLIKNLEYSPENYSKLLSDRDLLENKCMALFEENKQLKDASPIHNSSQDALNRQILMLKEENERLKIDNVKLIKQYKLDKSVIHDNDPSDNRTLVNNIQYNTISNSLKRVAKSKDGFYHIDGFAYSSLFGTRHDVWNRVAYKTAGCLTIHDLMINKYGKIVSKKKFQFEKEADRFHDINLLKLSISNSSN